MKTLNAMIITVSLAMFLVAGCEKTEPDTNIDYVDPYIEANCKPIVAKPELNVGRIDTTDAITIETCYWFKILIDPNAYDLWTSNACEKFIDWSFTFGGQTREFTNAEFKQRLGFTEPTPTFEDLDANYMGRYKVTAYCPCRKCCGRFSDGVTASGYVIRQGDRFVAAPCEIPFDTKLNIPGYGEVFVLDRGGKIKDKRLDVYFDDHKTALEWGIKYLDISKGGAV